MQAIDKVARLGSIRRAAEVIAISPSALNRQILSVEEEIGVEIFERLPRGVRLSTAGEIYLRCFQAHLAELDRAAAQVADLSGLRAGSIRVGVSEELASQFAPAAIAAYQAKYPMVNIALRVMPMHEIGPSIHSFDVDIGLVMNWVQEDAIETILAAPVDIVCVTSAASDLGEEINLSDLADRPLVAPTAGSGLRAAIDAALSYRNVPRRYALETDRLAAGMLRANRSAVQFAAAIDVDIDNLRRQDLITHRLSQATAPKATASLLSLRYRTLPVPSAKLVSQLANLLSQGS